MRDDLDAEIDDIDAELEELREQREEAQEQHERISGRIDKILEEQRELREVIDEIRTQLEADEAPTIFALESTLISEASMIEYGSKSPRDREAMIEHIEELAREEDWEVPQDKFEVGI
jgi:chromosome segregation protein